MVNPADPREGFDYHSQKYVADLRGRRFLSQKVVIFVDEKIDRMRAYEDTPTSAIAYWHRYVQLRYLRRTLVFPLFLVLFFAVLYFVGKIFAHGIGRWFVHRFEAGIERIPIINKVRGSVKQVMDLASNDRKIKFGRVVVVEYPREGIWSLGFVTSNGFPSLRDLAGEPVLGVLMPTSPMPMTVLSLSSPRAKRSVLISPSMRLSGSALAVVSSFRHPK